MYRLCWFWDSICEVCCTWICAILDMLCWEMPIGWMGKLERISLSLLTCSVNACFTCEVHRWKQILRRQWHRRMEPDMTPPSKCQVLDNLCLGVPWLNSILISCHCQRLILRLESFEIGSEQLEDYLGATHNCQHVFNIHDVSHYTYSIWQWKSGFFIHVGYTGTVY